MDPIKEQDGSTPGAAGTDPASLVATLRKLIIDGRYAAGVRLAEIPVAAALGVSRTPVRLAFRTLEQEGLLEKTGKRGYTVRAFSEADVLCALEVRGALEGLAARRLAEQGLPPDIDAALQDCLADGSAVLAKGHLTSDDIARWSQLNQRFHHAIVAGGGGRVIADAIARNDHLPFASAGSLVIDRDALEREFLKLQLAQMQHQLIADALRRRESARVEMLMREHAYIALRYGQLFGLAVQFGSGESLRAAPPRTGEERIGGGPFELGQGSMDAFKVFPDEIARHSGENQRLARSNAAPPRHPPRETVPVDAPGSGLAKADDETFG